MQEEVPAALAPSKTVEAEISGEDAESQEPFETHEWLVE
jgi:hypothetical protein